MLIPQNRIESVAPGNRKTWRHVDVFDSFLVPRYVVLSRDMNLWPDDPFSLMDDREKPASGRLPRHDP